MQWHNLTTEQQLNEIINLSETTPILLFKHSTRCSISKTTLDRLERNWKDNDNETVKPYYLDLITFRNVSNAIANQLNIEHESPQAIVLSNKKVIYHASHFEINYNNIIEAAKATITN